MKASESKKEMKKGKTTSRRDSVKKQTEDEDDDDPRKPCFPVAVRDPGLFNDFQAQLIFSTTKDMLISPIPFFCGMLKLELVREKGGFNVLHPSYSLYLEKSVSFPHPSPRSASPSCLPRRRPLTRPQTT